MLKITLVIKYKNLKVNRSRYNTRMVHTKTKYQSFTVMPGFIQTFNLHCMPENEQSVLGAVPSAVDPPVEAPISKKYDSCCMTHLVKNPTIFLK